MAQRRRPRSKARQVGLEIGKVLKAITAFVSLMTAWSIQFSPAHFWLQAVLGLVMVVVGTLSVWYVPNADSEQ